jgi:polar amino acid transport system substrate-binding protein
MVATACFGLAPSVAAQTSSTFDSACSDIRGQYPDIPKSLTVAISPYNANLESIDPQDPTKMQGVEPELLSNIAQCLNFNYTYSTQQFAGVIAAVSNNRADIGLTAIYITAPRLQVMDLVSHMKSVDQVVMNSNVAANIQSTDDLCGLTLGEDVGSAEVAYVQMLSDNCTNEGKPAINLQQYQDIGTLFLTTSQGQVDATINSDTLTASALNQYPGSLQAGFYVNDLQFVIGIAVSNNEPRLAQAVTAALQEIQNEGIDGAILTKWQFPAEAQVPAQLYDASTPPPTS